MPAEETNYETSRWVRYAREDLALALAIRHENGTPRHCCSNAQQSAEKAIKSAFVWLKLPVPRSHDLVFLQSKLPERWKIRETPENMLAELSLWAVESRYPGDMLEASVADAERAIEIAELITATMFADLEKYGYSG